MKIITHLLISAFTLAALSRAPGQVAMDANLAEKTRFDGKVAIFYCSQFEKTAIHDWVPIKEWNGPYHPLLGEYKTSDRKVIRKHLEWLRRAGVDVIVYDVARIQPEHNLFGLPDQKTLQLLVAELAHQEKETRKLQLVVWMEKWNSNPTPAEYQFGFDYIRKHLADRDFYYRLEGKPLVMTYLNKPAPEFTAIEQANEAKFAIRHITPKSQAPGWKYFGPAGDQECFTVNPGANGFMEEAFIRQTIKKQPIDVPALRQRGKAAIQQRADGKFYENQLLKARAVDPKIIFISGWNDWAWCLQIEPAKEYEFKYVDMTARLLGRSAETLPYRQGRVTTPARTSASTQLKAFPRQPIPGKR